KGWTRVDPTAAVAPERIERGLEAAVGEDEPVPGRLLRGNGFFSQIRFAWDAINTFWNDQIVAFDEKYQRAMLANLGIDEGDGRALELGLVAILAAFFTELSLLLAWQFRPRSKDLVTRLYTRLCKKLGKHQLPRAPHEGPMDYLNRVARQR